MEAAIELQKSWRSQRWPANGEQAVALAERAGLLVLGIGGRRLCVATQGPGEVLKLAWQPGGVADNVLEARLWQWASPELRRLLCPVIGLTGEQILRQVRCRPAAAEALGARGRALCAQLARHGISDCSVNLGLLADPEAEGGWRVVCYDFGLVRPELGMQLLSDGLRVRD